MRVRPWIHAVLLLSAAGLQSQHGQDAQPPTFVAGVHSVRVDLYASRGAS